MFHIADKQELNQVSLTGVRAIVLLGLLIENPRSLNELRELLLQFNLVDEKTSNDVIRVDINTLKAIGCKISRASKKTDYKYVLICHPFELKITQEEINVIKKVYKKVRENADYKHLIEYHNLFLALSKFIFDEETREKVLGISVLRQFDIDAVKALALDCQHKNQLDLLYRTPQSRNETRKTIIAQQLVYKNDKIYLYGYDIDNNVSTVLNIKRILKIFSRKESSNDIDVKRTIVKFYLDNSLIAKLDENETIIEQQENKSLIEGVYYNDFLAVQRILSFSRYCEVIEPLGLRSMVITKLREMKKNYE